MSMPRSSDDQCTTYLPVSSLTVMWAVVQMTTVPPRQVSLSEASYETLETTCVGVLRVFLKHDIFEGGCAIWSKRGCSPLTCKI
jgi:hypothetical protein